MKRRVPPPSFGDVVGKLPTHRHSVIPRPVAWVCLCGAAFLFVMFLLLGIWGILESDGFGMIMRNFVAGFVCAGVFLYTRAELRRAQRKVH